ncbi:MAG: RidA family protein, partial [Pseudomonadota bacterium]
MRTVLAHNPYCVAGPYQDIYSHAVETDARRTLYVSGQVGVANDGSVVDSFAGQTRQAIANLIAVIEGAGMSPQNIVRLGFFLVRRADFAELADLRR